MLGTEGCQDSSYSLLQSGIQFPSAPQSLGRFHMKLPLSSGQVTALIQCGRTLQSTAPGVLTLFKNKQ